MAVDYFLKLDGIDGESQDKTHKGDIDLHSWSWGATNQGSSSLLGGGGAGKVSMQDFNFTMPHNNASPKLMLACASGEHIKKAVLVCRKQGKDQQEFLKIVLSDVLVSSYQTGGSAGEGSIPLDQVSINFSKIEHTYKPQKADGTLGAAVITGWDTKQNVKV
jgi:type VI secretion system secreted protein Hcp